MTQGSTSQTGGSPEFHSFVELRELQWIQASHLVQAGCNCVLHVSILCVSRMCASKSKPVKGTCEKSKNSSNAHNSKDLLVNISSPIHKHNKLSKDPVKLLGTTARFVKRALDGRRFPAGQRGSNFASRMSSSGNSATDHLLKPFLRIIT